MPSASLHLFPSLPPARILDPFLRPEPPPLLFLSQKMPRFFTGDELGNVKSFMYAPSSTAESKSAITTLYDESGKGKECAVQKLAIHTSGDGPIIRFQELCLTPTHSLGLRAKLVVARVDGFASVSKVHAQGLDTIREWTEPRLKPAQRYVGLAASSAYVFFFLILRRHRGQLLNQFSRGLYSCTSNGALRFAPFGSHVDAEPSRTAVFIAHASMLMAPRARWNDVLLRRRRSRALSLGRRGRLCAEIATTACNHEHRIAPTTPKHQEAQTQHRATPSRRIVASEKCMFQ